MLWAAAIFVYAFLYVPLFVVVAYSFNDSRLNAECVGFTLDWYRRLLHHEEMLQAAANSLFIAAGASSAATVLGTMAGIAMHRYAYSITLIGYNVEKMRQLGLPTDSWAVIFEPKSLEKLKARVTVLDSQRELMTAALLYLGHSGN
jgi:ABC-type nitrate/sulfonate/bicarbonate transport system permease component